MEDECIQCGRFLEEIELTSPTATPELHFLQVNSLVELYVDMMYE